MSIYDPAPYYRIYNSPDKGWIPVCVQHFDLPDYDAERWVVNEDFATEQEALDRIMALSPNITISGEAYEELLRMLDEPPRDLPKLRALLQGARCRAFMAEPHEPQEWCPCGHFVASHAFDDCVRCGGVQ